MSRPAIQPFLGRVVKAVGQRRFEGEDAWRDTLTRYIHRPAHYMKVTIRSIAKTFRTVEVRVRDNSAERKTEDDRLVQGPEFITYRVYIEGDEDIITNIEADLREGFRYFGMPDVYCPVKSKCKEKS